MDLDSCSDTENFAWKCTQQKFTTVNGMTALKTRHLLQHATVNNDKINLQSSEEWYFQSDSKFGFQKVEKVNSAFPY